MHRQTIIEMGVNYHQVDRVTHQFMKSFFRDSGELRDSVELLSSDLLELEEEDTNHITGRFGMDIT
jgi:hypothetical protein